MTLHPSDPRHDGPLWNRLSALALANKVQYHGRPEKPKAGIAEAEGPEPPKEEKTKIPRGKGPKALVVLHPDGAERVYTSMRAAFDAAGVAYRAGISELGRYGFVFTPAGVRIWRIEV